MSIFGNTKALKSIYMSIFGFNIVVNTSQTVGTYSFQSTCKGAHLYVCIYPTKQPIFPKALTYVCLSNIVGMASCNKQTTSNLVGKSGQGTDSTAIKNPGKRNGEHRVVSQPVTHQDKVTVCLFKPIASRHWSETYQRLTKMPQRWKTNLYGGGKAKLIQLGHPLISIGEDKFIHRIMDRVFIGNI